MNTLVPQMRRRLVMLPLFATLVALLLGMIGLAPVPAAVAGELGPAPTVGEIIVDSFSCETGEIRFHVQVTDLLPAPEGSSAYQFPLVYNVSSNFEDGSSESSNFSAPFVPFGFNPPATGTLYSGVVDLSATVSTVNRTGAQPGTTAITSITLYVAVGYGGFDNGPSAFGAPTDSSTLTVQCDGDEPDLVEQLIELLIAILEDILGG